jgi:hypothetical protein
MPKEIPTVERFRVFLEVPVEHLGPAMSQLAKMEHVVVTGQELVTEMLRYKGRVQHETSTEQWFVEWIKDHPTFKIKEVVKAGKELGRTPASVYTAARTLVEKDVLKKLGDGAYSRADVKAIEGPTKKKRKPVKAKTYDKTGDAIILAYASKNHGKFNVTKLKELFDKEGRPTGSVYPSVDKIIKRGLAKRVGESGSGQYELVRKSKPNKKTPQKTSPLNGAEATTITETSKEV